VIKDSTTALIIFIILLVLSIFLLAEADAIVMDLLGWTLRDTPVVCLNNLSEYKWATLKAIQIWNDHTITPQWHISSTTYGECNIYVNEWDTLGTGGLGQALCNSVFCEIEFDVSEERETIDKVRTATHEMGHVLSLGHFPYPLTVEEALWLGACNESVMWQRGECGYPQIPQELLDALLCRHTSDGFGGVIDVHCKY